MPKGFREKSAQYRAVVKNRRSLRARGLARFEVRGLDSDKALVRDLAKRLSAGDELAQALRDELIRKLAPQKGEPGSVWRWLRSSPLVGVDWYIERPYDPGRKIDI
jgi:hypothetical protein